MLTTSSVIFLQLQNSNLEQPLFHKIHNKLSPHISATDLQSIVLDFSAKFAVNTIERNLVKSDIISYTCAVHHNNSLLLWISTKLRTC